MYVRVRLHFPCTCGPTSLAATCLTLSNYKLSASAVMSLSPPHNLIVLRFHVKNVITFIPFWYDQTLPYFFGLFLDRIICRIMSCYRTQNTLFERLNSVQEVASTCYLGKSAGFGKCWILGPVCTFRTARRS